MGNLNFTILPSTQILWNILSQNHCSFRLSTTNKNFCINAYNLTGLCRQIDCPLANEHYVTVTEEHGRCYLVLKNIERTHLPGKSWQKIRLKKIYTQAIDQINHYLLFWPQYFLNKSKQRLNKIFHYFNRLHNRNLRVNSSLITNVGKVSTIKKDFLA